MANGELIILGIVVVAFGAVALPILFHDTDTGANIIEQLFDVNVTNATSLDILNFNATSEMWEIINFTNWLNNIYPSTIDGQVLTFNATLNTWVPQNVNNTITQTHTNLGSGARVFKNETSNNANFRTLVGSGGVSITEFSDTIQIGTGGGGNRGIATITTPNGIFNATTAEATVAFVGNGVKISNGSSIVFNATLSNLFDVNVTDMVDGDILFWNETSQYWEDESPATFTALTDVYFNAEEASISDLTGVDCVNDITYSFLDGASIDEYRRQAIDFCSNSDTDDNITWNYVVPKSYNLVNPTDFKFRLYWTDEGSGGGTFEKRVVASTDDAEQDTGTGAMTLTSIDLDMSPTAQYVGMRWTNVLVPAGATIVDARIQFTTQSVTTGANPTAVITGHDVDNAPTFTSTNGDITSRVSTTASVNWSIPPWPTVGQEGAAQLTPNLASIVQEIVDRAGWASGNSMVLKISQYIGGGTERDAWTWNGDSAQAPKLTISYTTGTQLPVCFELSFMPLANTETMDTTFSGRQTQCVNRSGLDNLSETTFTVPSSTHNFNAEDHVWFRIHRPNDYVANDYEEDVFLFSGSLEWLD